MSKKNIKEITALLNNAGINVADVAEVFADSAEKGRIAFENAIGQNADISTEYAVCINGKNYPVRPITDYNYEVKIGDDWIDDLSPKGVLFNLGLINEEEVDDILSEEELEEKRDPWKYEGLSLREVIDRDEEDAVFELNYALKPYGLKLFIIRNYSYNYCNVKFLTEELIMVGGEILSFSDAVKRVKGE